MRVYIAFLLVVCVGSMKLNRSQPVSSSQWFFICQVGKNKIQL